ncbi:MAG TPA: TIGR02679 family protein, partial [Planctomycetaceae bacterium]|nr:TIGR02679 family protein [Planctomycetaceae bacterium]
HALDHGQPLSTLVIRAAVRLGDSALPPSAQERRRVWYRVGVVCDELSSPVLALNLIADERSFTGRLLRLSAAEGEPCRITSRQLLRHPPQFDPTSLGERVYVCENPSVLAAAANALGRACPPMVCIDGQPTTAAHLLLTALTRAKLTLWYHGDFDWGGLRIANLMRARYDAHPWRMSTADYLVADSGRGVKLNARAVNAAWDSDLMTAMLQRGFAVHEEQVQGVLIDDLRKTVTIGTNSASAV